MKNECENLSLYFYGELEPEASAAFERHLGGCALCRKDLEFLRRMQQALEAPSAPQSAVEAVLSPRRAGSFWKQVLKPALGVAVAVGLGVLFFVSGPRFWPVLEDGEDLVAYISYEADQEYRSFTADFDAFENEF